MLDDGLLRRVEKGPTENKIGNLDFFNISYEFFGDFWPDLFILTPLFPNFGAFLIFRWVKGKRTYLKNTLFKYFFGIMKNFENVGIHIHLLLKNLYLAIGLAHQKHFHPEIENISII